MADAPAPAAPAAAAPAAAATEPDLFAGLGGQPTNAAPTAPSGGPGVAPAAPPATTVAETPQSPPAASPEAPGVEPLDTAHGASPLDTAEALGLGAAKGVFASKDFFTNVAGLWGSAPKEEDRSGLRQWIDQKSEQQAAKWGTGYSFAEGLSQAAVGLLGVGKLAWGPTAVKVAGATIGGVSSFGPHDTNFANLAQRIPGMNGPFTAYLASNDQDSDFKGYMKNALTSLGVTAASTALFVGGAAMLKALSGGDKAAIKAAGDELEASLGAHVQEQQEQGAWKESSTPGQTSGELPSASSPSMSPSVSSGSSAQPGSAGETLAATPSGDGLGGKLTWDQPSGESPSGTSPSSAGYTSSTPPAQPGSDGGSSGGPTGGPTPPVAEGNVRFYHGATKGSDPQEGQRTAWLTPDADYAKNFGSTESGKDVYYVDLPKDHPTAVAAQTWDSIDESAGTNAVGRYGHVEAPADVAAGLKPYQPEGASGRPPLGLAPGDNIPGDSSTLAGGADKPGAFRPFKLDEDAFTAFLETSTSDQDALLRWGSWDGAIMEGEHTFASGAKIPWQKIGGTNEGTPETQIDAFMARVAEAYKAQADALKGGDVQTDAMTQRAVDLRVKLWGQNQAQLLGALQASGERAGEMRATMQAGFTVAQKMMQDCWTLASRIDMGDFTDFGGSQEGALAALKAQVNVAATAFASANSILANAGRTLRGARSEFALDPIAIRNMASLSPTLLVKVLTATQGDPRALAAAIQPGLLSRLVEGAQLFMVNNLISNPLTHAVIAMSNTWQVLTRPLERMIGSVANGTTHTVGLAAQKSYGYLGSSIGDALHSAVQAFKVGDSIIAPHDPDAALDAGSGGAMAASGLGQQIAQMQYGPWNNVGDIYRNILVAMAKTGTFPTRGVQFQDELVKQLVYRSTVQGNAYVEGSSRFGLTGEDLADYVKDRLYNAFDDYGQGTDPVALQEAKVATYQNDLNPTGWGGFATQGFKMQQALSNNPPARIVIPFLRTPVNLFRQGVQLTPGLNMAQKEYWDTIMGHSGETAQAQAIGQMAVGSLIMGSIGLMAYQGLVTGDAPSDPKLAAEATQDGWRPNSIVWSHPDGTLTYVPFDRYDPIMLPFSMAANIVSILGAPEMANTNRAQQPLEALSVGLLKQLTDKLYLQNLKSTIDAIQDPDRTFGKWAGGIAHNYVPAASLLKLVDPDPIMREADTFVQQAIKGVPGLSSTLPARRDYGGDPITVHKGLWLNTPESKVDAEVQRLALQQGSSIGAPSSKAKGGADLRAITLSGNADPQGAGMNAYDRYQELAGHPERMPGANPSAMSLKATLGKLIASEEYQKMPDGAPNTPGTKISTLADVIHGFRQSGMGLISADKNVQAAEFKEMQRVSSARGMTDAPNPTPTNTLDGMLNRLGKAVGLQGLHAPSPATPTTATQ